MQKIIFALLEALGKRNKKSAKIEKVGYANSPDGEEMIGI